MFDFLRKKKEYKRPDYYPIFKLKYVVKLNEKGDYITSETEFNPCCKTMKEGLKDDKFWSLRGTHNWNLGKKRPENKLFFFLNGNYGFSDLDMPIWYCPFCGAKIKIIRLKTLKKVKTGCDEIIEPEQVIPAKTRKVCKYEWQEVEGA